MFGTRSLHQPMAEGVGFESHFNPLFCGRGTTNETETERDALNAVRVELLKVVLSENIIAKLDLCTAVTRGRSFRQPE
jgi:hypothetical protein